MRPPRALSAARRNHLPPIIRIPVFLLSRFGGLPASDDEDARPLAPVGRGAGEYGAAVGRGRVVKLRLGVASLFERKAVLEKGLGRALGGHLDELRALRARRSSPRSVYTDFRHSSDGFNTAPLEFCV